MEDNPKDNPSAIDIANGNTTFDVSNEASDALRRYEMEQRLNAALPSYQKPIKIALTFESIEKKAMVVLDKEVTLGRQDTLLEDALDLDLAPYGGYQLGVSRKHAVFRKDAKGHVHLVDMGSRNGTFINGKKLDAYIPAPIVDGDLVRLGKLVARIEITPED
jgi:hypothetical protein